MDSCSKGSYGRNAYAPVGCLTQKGSIPEEATAEATATRTVKTTSGAAAAKASTSSTAAGAPTREAVAR